METVVSNSISRRLTSPKQCWSFVELWSQWTGWVQHNTPISLSLRMVPQSYIQANPLHLFLWVTSSHLEFWKQSGFFAVCSTCFRHEPAESSVICSRAVGSNFLLQNCPKMNRLLGVDISSIFIAHPKLPMSTKSPFDIYHSGNLLPDH